MSNVKAGVCLAGITTSYTNLIVHSIIRKKIKLWQTACISSVTITCALNPYKKYNWTINFCHWYQNLGLSRKKLFFYLDQIWLDFFILLDFFSVNPSLSSFSSHIDNSFYLFILYHFLGDRKSAAIGRAGKWYNISHQLEFPLQ